MLCCKEMEYYLVSNEVAINYISKFREYGIDVLDGGTSIITILFCPWCGKKLPDTLREKWFEILDEIGLEPESPDIPEKYLSDKWWNEKS
jgi:hypothetical protein